jgi:hypothetical protein
MATASEKRKAQRMGVSVEEYILSLKESAKADREAETLKEKESAEQREAEALKEKEAAEQQEAEIRKNTLLAKTQGVKSIYSILGNPMSDIIRVKGEVYIGEVSSSSYYATSRDEERGRITESKSKAFKIGFFEVPFSVAVRYKPYDMPDERDVIGQLNRSCALFHGERLLSTADIKSVQSQNKGFENLVAYIAKENGFEQKKK